MKQLFSLTQYGFTAADFGGGARFPAGLQIRVWEANDVNKYFPAENVAYVLDRRAERQRAREECIRLLAAMDDLEKHELFKGDKGKDEPAPVPAPAPARALSAPRSRDVTPAAGAGAGAPSSCATPSPTKRVKSAEDVGPSPCSAY